MTPKLQTTNPTLTSATFEDLVREMLVRLDEDPEREGLQRTPARVHKAFEFLTRGYSEMPLLKAAKGAIHAPKPVESGEYRL